MNSARVGSGISTSSQKSADAPCSAPRPASQAAPARVDISNVSVVAVCRKCFGVTCIHRPASCQRCHLAGPIPAAATVAALTMRCVDRARSMSLISSSIPLLGMVSVAIRQTIPEFTNLSRHSPSKLVVKGATG